MGERLGEYGGVAKFHFSSQWASVVSSWQHVDKHCHETKLWPSLNLCKKKKKPNFFHVKTSYKLQNQILKEEREN